MKQGKKLQTVPNRKDVADTPRRGLKKKAEREMFKKLDGDTGKQMEFMKEHRAARFKRKDINLKKLELLLAAGADVNVKDDKGYNLLWTFNLGNNQAVTKLLMAKGIDTNQKMSGFTLLWNAVRNNDLELVTLLVQGGADINVKDDENGETALHVAARAGQAEIVGVLLSSQKADIHAKDNKGNTPFLLAKERRKEI